MTELKNQGPLKVLIVAPMSRYSGYGSDGIDMASALMAKGVDVYLQPTNVQPPLPTGIASLLTKNLEAPFDLIIHHVDPGHIEATKEQKAASDLIVGWSMWEMSSLDNMGGKSSFFKRLKYFDALLGYSDVSTNAFKGKAPKKLPLGTLQGGYEPELWPYLERDWSSDRFSFIMHGALGPRKNPMVAVMAFSELKDEYPEEFEPAEMHVHTTVPGMHPSLEELIPKFRIHYTTFSEDEMLDFYQSGHVLITPSRGEGKNLPAIEMLSTGGSVIATNWSGHCNWLSNSYAYPLDYTLQPMGIPGHFNCKWAEADKDHLKQLMLHCFRNRHEVMEKGRIGSKLVPQLCSWDSIMDNFFRHLPELCGEKGQLIFNKYDAVLRENEAKSKGILRYA